MNHDPLLGGGAGRLPFAVAGFGETVCVLSGLDEGSMLLADFSEAFALLNKLVSTDT